MTPSEPTSFGSLLEFPCEFPIKVIGRSDPLFEGVVMEIVRKHAPDLGEAGVAENYSRKGNYLAMTIKIMAKSQAQLDAIYMELTAHPLILMVF